MTAEHDALGHGRYWQYVEGGPTQSPWFECEPLYAHPTPAAADGEVERLRQTVEDQAQAIRQEREGAAEAEARATAAEARVAALTEALTAEREACARAVEYTPRTRDPNPDDCENDYDSGNLAGFREGRQWSARIIRARSAPATSEDVVQGRVA